MDASGVTIREEFGVDGSGRSCVTTAREELGVVCCTAGRDMEVSGVTAMRDEFGVTCASRDSCGVMRCCGCGEATTRGVPASIRGVGVTPPSMRGEIPASTRGVTPPSRVASGRGVACATCVACTACAALASLAAPQGWAKPFTHISTTIV